MFLSSNGRDKVSGGKGKDTVRSNHNERRRVKGCERRYSIK